MNKQSLKPQTQAKYKKQRARSVKQLGVKGQQGKHLETLVDMVNKQYYHSGLADIRKIPTPVQITSRNGQFVTGRLEKAEFVDYLGITSQARPVIFDTKETSSRTSFPLGNLHAHQFDLLKSWHEKGAVSFLLVCFMKREYETYVLPFKLLEKAWAGYIGDGPKSIKYEVFVNECEQVKSEKNYLLHYLKAVNLT